MDQDNKFIAAFKLHPIESANSLADNSLSSAIRESEDLIQDKIRPLGGRVIGSHEGYELFELDVEDSEVIKEIMDILQDRLSPTCGIGEDPEQAIKSCKFAEKFGHDIKVFDSSVDDFDDKAESRDSDKLNDLDTLSHIRNSITKSEPQEEPKFLSDEDKQKILDTIQQVQQNKEMFEQLQQASPEVYMGIVAVIKNLTEMVKQDKVKSEEHLDKKLESIISALQKEKEKKIKSQHKEFVKVIGKENEKIEAEKRESAKQRGKELRKEKAKNWSKYSKYAEQAGHNNPEFFHQLAKEFKRK